MFCRYCGAQLPEGAAFCAYCGQPVAQPQQQQQQQQQVYQQPQTQQPYQQQYQQQPYQQQQSFQQPYQQAYRSADGQFVPQQGMKWHKFLVYFSLWANALISLIYGITALTGAQYGEYRDLVYTFIPGMKAPDMVYGLLLLCLAILAVVTALSLLKFKAKGPKLLTFLYLWGVVCSLFYLIWAISVLSRYDADTGDVIARAVPSLIVSLIMVAVNKVYYSKRAHLFVN